MSTVATVGKDKSDQESSHRLIFQRPKRGTEKPKIKPEDRRSLNRAKDRVRLALQIVEDMAEFNEQFEKLLMHLGKWIWQHRGDIEKAFLTLRDSALLFLIIRKGVKFDMKFDEQLCDLALEIARHPDFSRVKINVLALPNIQPNSAESFIAPFRMEYIGLK